MFQPRAKIRVPANRLRSGSRKRSQEGIATVRHLYPDFDIEGEAGPTSLRASDTVPTPTAFLSTSVGKYQILCRVDSFTFEGQKRTLKLLTIPVGGDRACTDSDRVLRISKFRNCKYDPPYPVTVTYPCDSTSNPGDFRLDLPAANAMLLPHAIQWRKHSGQHPNSEHDWAWILHELAHRKNAAKVTRTLAFRLSDKPRPLCYVQRSVGFAIGRTLPYRKRSDGGRCHTACGAPVDSGLPLRYVSVKVRQGRARGGGLQRGLHLGGVHGFCEGVEGMILYIQLCGNAETVLRTGRMVDTSPPNWELRSAKEISDVYAG